MYLLFDENVPKKLRRLLKSHKISTAQEQGWDQILNGKLLQAAELAGFEAMLTCDKNIVYQQNLRNRNIALIVLSTNDWSVIKYAVEIIVDAINKATPGSYIEVDVSPV